jgi:flavin-dependent dehydrogenase
MSSMQRPVTIAGAGVSGLTAAINLAKAGVEVDVYERKKEVGGRFLGDWQGLENWTTTATVESCLSDMQIDINFDCHALPPLLLTDGHDLQLRCSFQRPVCYLVKRGPAPGTLDQGLKAQALAAGVRLHLGQAIDPAQANIIATGPNSRETFAVDKGIIWQTQLPDMAIFLVNESAAYKGYAYLLIHSGYACLCTVLFDRFQAVNECLEKAKSMIGTLVDLDIQAPRFVGGLGSIALETEFMRGGNLLVGEAAGIQDFLWGFGIRTAMQSGYLAAQSILHQTSYPEMAQNAFHPRIKSGIVTRFLYDKAGSWKSGYKIMGQLAGNRPDPGRFFQNAYKMTVIHQFIYPLARWSMQRKYPKLRL